MRKRLAILATCILLLLVVSATSLSCISKKAVTTTPVTSDRLSALETKVAQQAEQIANLQFELNLLKQEVK